MLKETLNARLDDFERQELLLYLINKAGSVEENRCKLHDVVYLLNEDLKKKNIDVFPYRFNSFYLRVRDEVLTNDVRSLAHLSFIEVTPIATLETLGSPSIPEKITVSKVGASHLRVLDVKKKMKIKIGADTLETIEEEFQKYNQMPDRTLMEMVRRNYRFTYAPEAASYGNE